MVASADLRRFRQHPALIRAAAAHDLRIDSVGHDVYLFDEQVCLRCSASRADFTVSLDVHWPELGTSAGFHVLPRHPDAVTGAAAFQDFMAQYEPESTDAHDIAYEVRFVWVMKILADMVRSDTLRLRPDELAEIQPELMVTPRADSAHLAATVRGLVTGDVPPLYVQIGPDDDPAVMGVPHPQINGIDPSAHRTHELIAGLQLGRPLEAGQIEADAFLMRVGAAETDVMSVGMHLGEAGLFVSPTLGEEMAAYTLHGTTQTPVVLNARYPDHARNAVFVHIRQADDLIDMDASVFVRSTSPDQTERVPLADVDDWRTQLNDDIVSGRDDRLRPERIELVTYPDLFRLPVTGQVCASVALVTMLRHQGRTGWWFRHHGQPIY